MIITILTIIHVLVCFFLVLIVLLQSGKAGDISSLFGGGASQSLFSATGGQSMLSKVTTGLAVAFMITSIMLATLPLRLGTSASGLQGEMSKEDKDRQQAAPAPAPGTAPAAPEQQKGSAAPAPEKKSTAPAAAPAPQAPQKGK